MRIRPSMKARFLCKPLRLFLGIVLLALLPLASHSQSLDSDCDGFPDDIDTCLFVYNPDQSKTCGEAHSYPDGTPHCDRDGIPNDVDNCPCHYNPCQQDWNGNGVGDACEDSDQDGILDADDNCPGTANPDQADSDG